MTSQPEPPGMTAPLVLRGRTRLAGEKTRGVQAYFRTPTLGRKLETRLGERSLTMRGRERTRSSSTGGQAAWRQGPVEAGQRAAESCG